MKKHHTERLLRLADLLDGVRPRLFNLGYWYDGPGKYHGKMHDAKKPECRTVACAAGWAACDPWFKKRGLSLSKDNSPRYRGKVGFRAVRSFFGINEDDAGRLFMASASPAYTKTRPRTVAMRIRRFVADQERAG